MNGVAVENESFPVQADFEEQMIFLLRSAVLAPSTYNTQPWKFAVSTDGIAVFADYARRMPVVDKGNRELLLSIGAAVMNLRIAAVHFGFSCRVEYNHSGDSERPLAVAFLAPASRQERASPLAELFPAIARRRTNRASFLLSRVPETVLKRIRAMGEGFGGSLLLSTDGTVNRHVADLVAAADRLQLGRPAVRGEIAEWMRSAVSEKNDGLPGAALGLGAVAAAMSPWATKILDLGRLRAAHDKNLCIEAPALLVIGSEDAVPQWLEAGEMLERVLLTLTLEGLHASYFNMPVQVPELRVELRRLFGLSAWPQLLLRIGYCLTEPVATPRRPIEEVIVTTIHS
jgi:hypothetical protein